jgi:hypothetical protein
MSWLMADESGFFGLSGMPSTSSHKRITPPDSLSRAQGEAQGEAQA